MGRDGRWRAPISTCWRTRAAPAGPGGAIHFRRARKRRRLPPRAHGQAWTLPSQGSTPHHVGRAQREAHSGPSDNLGGLALPLHRPLRIGVLLLQLKTPQAPPLLPCSASRLGFFELGGGKGLHGVLRVAEELCARHVAPHELVELPQRRRWLAVFVRQTHVHRKAFGPEEVEVAARELLAARMPNHPLPPAEPFPPPLADALGRSPRLGLEILAAVGQDPHALSARGRLGSQARHCVPRQVR